MKTMKVSTLMINEEDLNDITNVEDIKSEL